LCFADRVILATDRRAFVRLVRDSFDVFSGYNEGGWRWS